jgi:tight adherence protein B
VTGQVLMVAVLAAFAVTVATIPPPRRGPLVVAERSPSVTPLRRLTSLVGLPQTSHARDVAELASTLATELRAGQHPEAAWRNLVSHHEALPGVVVPEADVVVVLRRWGAQPGWSGLRAVAVCWAIADASGAGLADALDRVAESMRHEHEIALEVHGQLATTRATTMLLATLPLVAVAMASVLGADLVTVLTRSWIGIACLVAGTALIAIGSWWVHRQVQAVREGLQW